MERIAGFDLARAYAVFGMFIVNFNTVFGSHSDHTGLSGFLNLFNGNSSTVFVMLAGMGVSLSSRKAVSDLDRSQARGLVMRRSWFLFFFGLAFYLWWPADILHFYGAYLHIGALLMFAPSSVLLLTSVAAIVGFHVLVAILPYSTGWNFETFQYADFWTVGGFLRNTLYNGWNPVFPWVAFFIFGMYLGRQTWSSSATKARWLVIGVLVYLITEALRYLVSLSSLHPELKLYFSADYLPPFLPFMASTGSFGLIIISLFMHIPPQITQTATSQVLIATGKMTLTHYVLHLTLGFFLLAVLTGRELSLAMIEEPPVAAWIVLMFSCAYFLLSCAFTYFWTLRFKSGPLENVMRRIAG